MNRLHIITIIGAFAYLALHGTMAAHDARVELAALKQQPKPIKTVCTIKQAIETHQFKCTAEGNRYVAEAMQ